jgi:hypothetical protein
MAPPPQINMTVLDAIAFDTEQDKTIESATDNDETLMTAIAPPLTKKAFESVDPMAEQERN